MTPNIGHAILVLTRTGRSPAGEAPFFIMLDKIALLRKKGKEALSAKNLSVFKTADGVWKWIGVYSNSFVDDDYPVGEIISTASHKNFVAKVWSGEWEMPDLMLFHVEEWTVGKATYVDFWEVEPGIGFAIAAGYFYEYAYPVAEDISKMGEAPTMSHGMDMVVIRYEGNFPPTYLEHKTSEVTICPPGWEANQLTRFAADGKTVKSVDAGRRQPILRMGISEHALSQVEENVKEMAMKGKSQGRVYKDAEAETAAVAEEKEAAVDPAEEKAGDADEEKVAQDTPVAEEKQVAAKEDSGDDMSKQQYGDEDEDEEDEEGMSKQVGIDDFAVEFSAEIAKNVNAAIASAIEPVLKRLDALEAEKAAAEEKASKADDSAAGLTPGHKTLQQIVSAQFAASMLKSESPEPDEDEEDPVMKMRPEEAAATRTNRGGSLAATVPVLRDLMNGTR